MRIRNFTKMGEGLQCCRPSTREDLQWKGKICNVANLPPGGRSAMLQIFRGKVCTGEGLQYNTGVLPRRHFKHIVNDGVRRKALECMLLTTRYLVKGFFLYTHPCNMILSKKKCCLLLHNVSTESQKRTSALQIKRNFSPTRNMTRINVELAKSLLFSWQIYMCNLMTWYTK